MSKKLEEIAADAAAEWIKNSTTNHSLANACALYGYNAGFLAGYQAAQAIVEEELQAVQAQRVKRPGLGSAEYALKNVLTNMGSK
jgi:hypothetical protein